MQNAVPILRVYTKKKKKIGGELGIHHSVPVLLWDRVLRLEVNLEFIIPCPYYCGIGSERQKGKIVYL